MSAMLRAVLLGVLSLSVIGCKSSSETAQSQAGVAAGNVLEVSGSVTVRHGDVARPLAKGDAVEADDTIETGADGHVLIELVHNNATWELNANKKSKVRESLAWSEPKRDRSAKAVEQDTAAAGRPAERNAADTSATARADEAPMAPPTVQAPAAATAPAPPPAPGAIPPAEPAAAPQAPPTRGRGGASEADGYAAPKIEQERRDEVAPAPPPPPPKSVSRALVSPRAAAAPTGGEDEKKALGVKGGASDDRGGGGGAGAPSPGGAAAGPSSGKQESLLRARTKDITACWAGQKLTVQMHIVIKADGTASATLSSKGKLTPQIEACVKKVISTVEFPAKAAVVSIGFSS